MNRISVLILIVLQLIFASLVGYSFQVIALRIVAIEAQISVCETGNGRNE